MIVGAYRRDKLIRYDNRSDTKEDALGEAVDVEEMVLIVSVVIMIQCSNDDDDDNDGKAGHNIFGDIHHCHHYHQGNASLT